MELKLPNLKKSTQTSLSRVSQLTTSSIIYSNAASKTSKITNLFLPQIYYNNQPIICDIGESYCSQYSIIGNEIPFLECGMDQQCLNSMFFIKNNQNSFEFVSGYQSFINSQLKCDNAKLVKCYDIRSCYSSNIIAISNQYIPMQFLCESAQSCQQGYYQAYVVDTFICKGYGACEQSLFDIAVIGNFFLECSGEASCRGTNWNINLFGDTKVVIIIDGIYTQYIFKNRLHSNTI